MITVKHSRGWGTDGAAPLAADKEVATGDTMIWADWDIAGEAADEEHEISIDVSALKSLFILASADMTIDTNNGGAPDDTLVLKANQPVDWMENDEHVKLLTTDVTAMFVTQAGTSAATLKIRGSLLSTA